MTRSPSHRAWTLFLLLCLAFAPVASSESAELDRTVEELLAKMTLEEKVGQLNQYSATFDLTGPAPAEEWSVTHKT